jgi:hypothetical protein
MHRVRVYGAGMIVYFYFYLTTAVDVVDPQFMLKSVETSSDINDFRMSCYSLCQRETSSQILLSHGTNSQQAVVSSALVYHQMLVLVRLLVRHTLACTEDGGKVLLCAGVTRISQTVFQLTWKTDKTFPCETEAQKDSS